MGKPNFSDEFKRDAVARSTRLAGMRAQFGYKRRPGSYGEKSSLAVDTR